ncbi:hypothetical protein J6590_017504 [Homalodisca vitripennis]|nr:hypothetical protein J6590_017504 [Homalodisca vitripennis]
MMNLRHYRTLQLLITAEVRMMSDLGASVGGKSRAVLPPSNPGRMLDSYRKPHCVKFVGKKQL